MKTPRNINLAPSVLLIICIAVFSNASELTIEHTFTGGTPALASEVNKNFSDAAIAINDNNTMITTLVAQNQSLQQLITNQATLIADQQMLITTLQTQLTDLSAAVSELEDSNVENLASYLQIGTDQMGNPAAIFSGVNVHINNGSGETIGSPNNLGNLVIGYDELSSSVANPNPFPRSMCRGGIYLEETECIDNGHTWLLDLKSGSHNVIVGPFHRYVSEAGLVAGYDNGIQGYSSSVVGGTGNISYINAASISGGRYGTTVGQFSSISGGQGNITYAQTSSISGGSQNETFGEFSSILGGPGNIANGQASTISGGGGNEANGDFSSVSGGTFNTATGQNASVTGGRDNIAGGEHSTVAGGMENNAAAYSSSISGGRENFASGEYSSVSGGFSNSARGDYSSVSGGNDRQTPVTGTYDWVAGSLSENE